MRPKINLKYIGLLFVLVLISCFFHEFAHWVAGELLGNKMSMSLNTVKPISGTYIDKSHANVVTIAGPLLTLLQAILFYFLVDRSKNIYTYPLLFFPFVYRLSAGLANINSPNDEGRLSLSWGLDLYTISITISSFLLLLIIRFSLKNKIGLKFNVITFFLCALSLLAIVFFDQYFKINIIG